MSDEIKRPTQLEINAAAYGDAINYQRGEVDAPKEASNVYSTENAQLFANYFQMKHSGDGHLTTLGMPGEEGVRQAREIANFELRKEYYDSLLEQGYSQRDVALMSKWDSDEAHMPLEGGDSTTNKMQSNAFDAMMSVKYADEAFKEYQYDNAMYERYVDTSIKLSKEQYDPDGDGHYNLVESVLDEFDKSNDDEIRETFENMGGDQRRMLAFDGIHDEDQYLSYVRSSIKGLKDARAKAKEHGFFWHVGNFFKSVGHGFISGVMDIVKLPSTLLSLGGAFVSGVTGNGFTFDNPISRAMHSLNKGIDKYTTEAYDNAVGVDLDSWSGKIGNYTGQGLEIAAEAVLTLGVGPILTKGVAKAGEHVLEKTTSKAVEKSIEKIGGNAAARAIEKEAFKMAEKLGQKGFKKVVDDEMIKTATSKILKTTESKFATEAAAKAAIRLSKRGMLNVTTKELERLGLKEIEKETSKVAEKAVEKEVGKLAETEVVKAARSKGAIQHIQKIFSSGARTSDKAIGKALAGADYKMIEKMMKKPTGISNAMRYAFGRTDSLTKLFSIKSFANQVENSQAHGDNAFEALARGLFAYGTTNAVWGRMAHGNNPIAKMMGKGLRTSAEGAERSFVASSLIPFAGEVVKTASLMTVDGSIQGFISEGMRTVIDENGNKKFRWGVDILKEGFALDKIGENFVSALTMSLTGTTIRAFKSKALVRDGNGYLGKKAYKSTMEKLDESMSDSGSGLGAQIWDGYKTKAAESLGQDASKYQIIDYAALIAREEGGSLNKLVIDNYVRSNAYSYGIDLGNTLSDIEISYDEVAKDINQRLVEQMEDSTYASESDIDINTEFRQFVELSMMDNANLFDGQEIPEDISMNNWQPEDFVIAHAIYKTYGADIKRESERRPAIKKAFDAAESLKKDIGIRRYKALMDLKKTNVASLASRIQSGDDGAAKYVEFISDYKEATKGLNKNSKEYNDAILVTMRAHDMSIDHLNQEIGNGNLDAQEKQRAVKNALEIENNKIDNIVTTKQVSEVAKDILNTAKTVDDINGDSYNIDVLKNIMLEKKKVSSISREKYNSIYREVFGNREIKDIINSEPSKYKDIIINMNVMKEDYNRKTIIENAKKILDTATKNATKNPEGEFELKQSDSDSVAAALKSIREVKNKIGKIRMQSDDSVFGDIWKDITGDDFVKVTDELSALEGKLDVFSVTSSSKASGIKSDALTDAVNRLTSTMSSLSYMEQQKASSIIDVESKIDAIKKDFKNQYDEIVNTIKNNLSVEQEISKPSSDKEQEMLNVAQEKMMDRIYNRVKKLENSILLFKDAAENSVSFDPDKVTEEYSNAIEPDEEIDDSDLKIEEPTTKEDTKTETTKEKKVVEESTAEEEAVDKTEEVSKTEDTEDKKQKVFDEYSQKVIEGLESDEVESIISFLENC